MADFIKTRDVFNPERIGKILSDAQNIVIPATDAETLDGFTADFGYTYYPYPHTSVYRSPAVAESGILSRIQHRFWQFSLPKQYKKGMGKRHVGVVVYAAPGEELYFDIQWCDKLLGRVKIEKQDGSRHLIVVEDSVFSVGNMEVLQIITDCKNLCRIEYIAMLNSLPESDVSTPEVMDFTVSYSHSGMSLDFLTKYAAKTSVIIESEGKEIHRMEKELFHTVHSYDFTAPVGEYTAKVIAQTLTGDSFFGEYPFEIAPLPNGQDVEVPVEIVSKTDVLANAPLTFGVPTPRGRIFSIKNALLEGHPVQTRVLSFWEDGSVKWLLCDALLPREMKKKEILKATLSVYAGKAEKTEPKGTAIGDYIVKAGEGCLPFGVFDKEGEEIISPVQNPFEAVLGNGERLFCGTCSDVIVEEDGLYRTVLKYEVPLVDSDDTLHFINSVRVICDRRDKTVTLKHRFLVVSPMLEPALMGKKINIDLEKFPAARGALDGDKNEEPSIIRLKNMQINCGVKELSTPEYNGEIYKNGLKVVAMSDLGYKVYSDGKERDNSGRAAGEFAGDDFTFSIKDFWKLYPKSVEIKDSTLTVGILPEIDFDFPLTDEDAWHRLYFCYKDRQYRLKVGLAPTTELVFALGGEGKKRLPIVRCAVRPEINYLNSCGVFPYMAPKDEKSYPEYEKSIAKGLSKLKDDLDSNRCYGFHNYGDWYGESAFSWGNNEYDSPFCYLMEFLRGGEYDWYELGVSATRHLADIDTVNYSLRKSDIGAQHIHIPAHCGGYVPPYFKNKGKGSRCKPSHAWMEGPFMYYALTGDESVLESVTKSAKWFCDFGIPNYDFHNCREAGWHIIHLCGAYQVSGVRRYLNAAKVIVEKALSKQGDGEDGSWIRQLTSAHCGCHKPHCFGEAGFMLSLLMVGLGRYYDITKDDRVKDSIIRGSRWLIRKTFNFEKNDFAYSNCPVMFKEMTMDALTRYTTEPLAKAWELSGDPEIEDVLKRIIHCVGNIDDSEIYESGNSWGYAKFLCSDIRYTPLMINTFKKATGEKVEG